MTHDELLAKLQKDGIESWNYSIRTSHNAVAALRAVVERHKPYREDSWAEGYFECGECSGEIAIVYPCPTIKDIEKELQ